MRSQIYHYNTLDNFLPDGTDLNTILVEGDYFYTTAVNSPETGNGLLNVKLIAEDIYHQKLIFINGNIYQRIINTVASPVIGAWGKNPNAGTSLPILTSDSTSTGSAYTITKPDLPNPMPVGYSFIFMPSIISSSVSATLSINGSSAYGFSKLDNYYGVRVGVLTSNSPNSFLQIGYVYNVVFTGIGWLIDDAPIINPLSINGAVPVQKGGTGIGTLTGIVKANGTNPFTGAVMGTDYAQPRPVGSVLINTSSSASGINTGTWVNIGTATIGTTTVYYWERTA